MQEKIILISDIDPVDLLGVNNRILKQVEQKFPDLKIVARGRTLKIVGEDERVDLFEEKINLMISYYKKYQRKNY